MKKSVLFLLSAAALSVSGELAVSDVRVASRQPWANQVKVRFAVSGVTSETGAKFGFTAYDGETKIGDIDPAKVSGDVYADADGVCEVLIETAGLHPLADARRGLQDFRVGVEAFETSPILYKVINLATEPGTPHHIVYLTRADIEAGTHPGIPGALGGFEVNPVRGVDSFVWTGVTNRVATNNRYVNARLVLRRVPAGTFRMGADGVETTISKGFWIGVFPLTWGQYAHLVGEPTDADFVNVQVMPATTLPARGLTLTWDAMRGAASVWPQNGHTVDPASVCGLLCAKTGEDGFDLPTEAQWEWACRAGTTGTLYRDDAPLDALGNYAANGGNALAPPGRYLPNAWGLYDMIGNVWERVLDWEGPQKGGVDPWGAPSAASGRRLVRGGCKASGAANCTCVSRTADGNTVPDRGGDIYGFRLVQNGRW